MPARPWLTAPVDLLFVTVKAPDLLGALARVPPSLVAGATVVPLLNGIDHVPLLRAVFGDAAVTPMTVAVEATRVAPGVIEHLSPFNDYAVAADRPDTGPDAATVLQKAGLDVDSSAPDEATLLWRKLSFLGPLALITTARGMRSGRPGRPGPTCSTRWSPRPRPRRRTTGPASTRTRSRQRLSSLPATMRSSMLKDALAGAELELDAIAGPVLRAAPDGAPVTRSVVAEITGAAATPS